MRAERAARKVSDPHFSHRINIVTITPDTGVVQGTELLCEATARDPDLDEPELYIRASKGKSAEKVFKSLCSDISKELSKLKL